MVGMAPSRLGWLRQSSRSRSPSPSPTSSAELSVSSNDDGDQWDNVCSLNRAMKDCGLALDEDGLRSLTNEESGAVYQRFITLKIGGLWPEDEEGEPENRRRRRRTPQARRPHKTAPPAQRSDAVKNSSVPSPRITRDVFLLGHGQQPRLESNLFTVSL
eukprot:gnl/TRDRNA2_/TRDRNA2_44963_c0_seq1.p1 gnl/TRDRNA2_/TRDRNA2_44963_c0~~gnl/TRDRNA2_/TRDRNA2_44963_c0_seq1.p1  ORF type:complete len:159 (+),score=16.67 gnl/TRDRNA2_/TRDRNA2_44963_c0_seq1:60-536(+)